jgi:polysaccharide export outer membrane protein
LAFAVAASCGCQTVHKSEEQIARSNLPIEPSKVSMPDYVVEPPDLILVEVLEALPGRQIQGERLVRPDGTISLTWYGDLYVAGLTIDQIKEKVVIHLRKHLTDEALGLIAWDLNADGGKGAYVNREPKDSDRVFVDVSAYNSKVYYVQGDVGSPGRLTITGNETVLDAINYAGGLLPTAANQNIRLVRPVNLAAIVNAGDTTTNYQILPGDRLVVYRDPIVRATVFLDRLSAPFSTVVNSMLQYSFMARNIKSINVPINGVAPTTTSSGSPVTGNGAR